MAQINHVAYSWSMIELKSNITGDAGGETGLFIDCTSINWNTERKVDNIYGLGGQPRGRGFGNVTYEADMTIPYGTQLLLMSKSVTGTLMGLGEFNLVVSWANDLAQDVSTFQSVSTVTLAGCFFNQSGMESSQDDTSITKQFNLNPYRIYNNKAVNNNWSYEMYKK